MSTRLVNVRLDETHLRKVQRLREHGVAVSDLLREAIDRRFADLCEPPGAADVERRLEAIFARHPDPADLPSRTYDVHDRRGARAAVARRLERGGAAARR